MGFVPIGRYGVVHEEGERMLTTRELATMLNVKENTIVHDRRKGGVKFPPPVRFGKSVRYRPSVVKAWLDERQAQTAATDHQQ